MVWDPLSIAAVEGHPNHINSIVFDSVYWTDLGVPDDGCAGVPDDQVYDAETNPGGVRCTLADLMINVFGPRPPQNFAGIPLDNVGVQWGLEALKKGQITTAQFVDLNEKSGGLDVDAQWQPQRTEADALTLRRAYRSGAINTANNLDQVAIIDLRGPDPGAFHDAYRSWATRARIEREHGHFDNHVIWVGQVPLIGDPRWSTEAMLTMDRWLAAVEADDGDAPLRARRSSPTAPPTSATAARRSPPSSRSAPSASTSRCRPATARRPPWPARASPPTPTSARSSRCAAATTTRSCSRPTSGRASCARSRPACATGAVRGSSSRARCRGRRTRTPTAT